MSKPFGYQICSVIEGTSRAVIEGKETFGYQGIDYRNWVFGISITECTVIKGLVYVVGYRDKTNQGSNIIKLQFISKIIYFSLVQTYKVHLKNNFFCENNSCINK